MISNRHGLIWILCTSLILCFCSISILKCLGTQMLMRFWESCDNWTKRIQHSKPMAIWKSYKCFADYSIEMLLYVVKRFYCNQMLFYSKFYCDMFVVISWLSHCFISVPPVMMTPAKRSTFDMIFENCE